MNVQASIKGWKIDVKDDRKTAYISAYIGLFSIRGEPMLIETLVYTKLQLIKDYREPVESERRSIRATVLDLVDRHLIAIAPNPESKIFYLKMKGDYFRCLAEETLNNPELACTLAKMAFDAVPEELDTLNEEEACKDSAFNMQFLRDNFMDIRQCRRRM
eukprot:bmy_03691T0